MALLLAGFAAVQEYPQVMLAIRVCGAVFLILTGVRMLIAWRRPTATGNGSLSLRDAALPGFSQGFLCNITNAKAFLFFIALIGSTVPADAPPFERLVVGLIVVLHGWACWSAIVRMLQLAPVRTRLLAIQGGLTGLCGGLLVVLGALSLIPS
jgi:threonine/homoserine/homoserine lactone efflux protein